MLTTHYCSIMSAKVGLFSKTPQNTEGVYFLENLSTFAPRILVIHRLRRFSRIYVLIDII